MSLDPELHNRIIKAVHSFAVALDLGEIGGKVYVQLAPDEATGENPQTGDVTAIEFPCLLMTLEGEAEQPLDGDTENEEQSFPIRLWVADRNAAHNHARRPFYLRTRKAITDAFKALFKDGAGFPDVPEVYACQVQYGVMIDPRMRAYEFVASSALLRFRYTERRL